MCVCVSIYLDKGKESNRSGTTHPSVSPSSIPTHQAAIKRFLTREAQGKLEYGSGFGGDAEEDGEYFDPQFAEVDRVLAVETDEEGDDGKAEAEAEEGQWQAVVEGGETTKGKKAEGKGKKTRKFLVKWCGLPYHEVTWEKEEDLGPEKQGLARHLQAWEGRQTVPATYAEEATLEFSKAAYEAQPPYKHGGELRPYQWESVQWMAFNWSGGQGSILADEVRGRGRFSVGLFMTAMW